MDCNVTALGVDPGFLVRGYAHRECHGKDTFVPDPVADVFNFLGKKGVPEPP